MPPLLCEKFYTTIFSDTKSAPREPNRISPKKLDLQRPNLGLTTPPIYARIYSLTTTTVFTQQSSPLLSTDNLSRQIEPNYGGNERVRPDVWPTRAKLLYT